MMDVMNDRKITVQIGAIPGMGMTRVNCTALKLKSGKAWFCRIRYALEGLRADAITLAVSAARGSEGRGQGKRFPCFHR